MDYHVLLQSKNLSSSTQISQHHLLPLLPFSFSILQVNHAGCTPASYSLPTSVFHENRERLPPKLDSNNVHDFPPRDCSSKQTTGKPYTSGITTPKWARSKLREHISRKEARAPDATSLKQKLGRTQRKQVTTETLTVLLLHEMSIRVEDAHDRIKSGRKTSEN